MINFEHFLILGHGVHAEMHVLLGIKGDAGKQRDVAMKHHRCAQNVVAPDLAKFVGSKRLVGNIGLIIATSPGNIQIGARQTSSARSVLHVFVFRRAWLQGIFLLGVFHLDANTTTLIGAVPIRDIDVERGMVVQVFCDWLGMILNQDIFDGRNLFFPQYLIEKVFSTFQILLHGKEEVIRDMLTAQQIGQHLSAVMRRGWSYWFLQFRHDLFAEAFKKDQPFPSLAFWQHIGEGIETDFQLILPEINLMGSRFAFEVLVRQPTHAHSHLCYHLLASKLVFEVVESVFRFHVCIIFFDYSAENSLILCYEDLTVLFTHDVAVEALEDDLAGVFSILEAISSLYHCDNLTLFFIRPK